MHFDARNIDNNTVIEGDICIIGAGAAGISMALEWINSGHKVILLEGGGFEYEDKMQTGAEDCKSGDGVRRATFSLSVTCRYEHHFQSSHRL